MSALAGGAGSRPRQWIDIAEVGSLWGIRCVAAITRLAGRPVAHLFLRGIALYYLAAHAKARRASRAYLLRLGMRPSIVLVYRHLLTFAICTLDRLLFVTGNTAALRVEKRGEEHLREALSAGRGAIVLGAHLGSFEALCRSGLQIHLVGDFRNARRISAVLECLSPGVNIRLIEASEGVETALEIKQVIEHGGLVGILGDRPLSQGRTAQVDLLGGRVHLPTGPYLLAAVLRCPIFFALGLYEAPNRYTLLCEPFAEAVVLRRDSRARDARALAQEYARRVEYYCRIAPYNWFNFYDYWDD